MKSPYVCIMLLTASISVMVAQGNSTVISADINCDGKAEAAKLEYENDKVKFTVIDGSSGKSSSLIFGLEHAKNQESFCGKTIELSKFETIPNNSPNFVQGLGAVPEGHVSKKCCFEIRLSDGMCDSINVYWNHKSNLQVIEVNAIYSYGKGNSLKEYMQAKPELIRELFQVQI